MAQVTINGITFNNVPNKKIGTGVSAPLTQTNIGVTQTTQGYLSSEEFYTLVNAVDINWNGIRMGDVVINDTADLINWINSAAGQPGADGKSAYELYCDTVASGTPMSVEEWLLSLRGEKGDKGDAAETPTVLVSELDDLHDALLVRGGSSPVYAVMDVNNHRVGILMLVGDSAGHLVTQILYTHSLLDDKTGVIDFDQHDDTLLTQAQRSYGLRSPFITNGEWTKWQRPNLDYFNNMNIEIEGKTLSLNEDQPLTDLQRKNAKSNLGLTTASVEDIRSLWTSPKEEEEEQD